MKSRDLNEEANENGIVHVDERAQEHVNDRHVHDSVYDDE
jgi:hypothetical protein